ncbi:short-chain dehydrogenase [Variovorax sp. KBW07]|uniref:SDR family oxidoreductase n=1 Tax=Variovorax sp. KBW07 TaxID=2153358 RepID=UPI000F575C1D|nr:SDR family oxidoreductase [Variovorax sp. KBW07]RQO61031.1 short-chain dehydrogenase [Variovorax sp. KBW07]
MTLDDLIYKPGLLHDARILVTGGGSGLGRVMTEALCMLGATVYICGRREPVLAQTAAELTAAHADNGGGRVVPLVCDIRDDANIQVMLDAIWADGGALTGLINNAAGNFISRTEDLSARGFDAVTNIVLRGTFYLTLECGKRWLAEGRKASVASILTTWVWNGTPFCVPSAMAKSGLHAMTQSLAVEWGGRGIRFNAIAPGVFPTEGMSARLNPQGGERILGGNPMGRDGRMPELANLAVFLMGPGAEYLTGQTIAIDGAHYQATGGNFAGLASWTDEDWRRARENIQRVNATDREKRNG